jgi:adenosine deaminase
MIDPSLPLIDLHRHLDGAIRLETILDLGRNHNLELPGWDIETLRPHVQITEPQPGVMAFIAKFTWMVGVLVNYDSCRRVAYENVEDAFTAGLDYIELRFSPCFMAEPHHLDPQGVIESVIDGVACAARDTCMKVNLIGILSRTNGVDATWKELDALLHYRESLVAIDLAGDEVHFPGGWFIGHFRKAREAGLNITIHAGESVGSESIWQAVNELGATRIGHGVHAQEDPFLLDHLAKQRIGIECNLTSNVQTSTVRNYAGHPLRLFLENNLLATINTDDPGISGIDLEYEYNIAAPAAGLSLDQIHQAQRNSLEVAFLSSSEKTQLLAKKSNPSTNNWI